MGMSLDGADDEGAANDAWLSLRARAEAAVAASDASMTAVRDAAMMLSMQRRRAAQRGEPDDAEPLSVRLPPLGESYEQTAAGGRSSLPAAWDVGVPPSPRAHLLLEDGARVAVEDSFARPGCGGAASTVWWEATVERRTGRLDALDRPVYDILFDDLEIQYTDGDGEVVVHAEEGGPAAVVFLNDTVLLELSSGQEVAYKRIRPPTDAGTSLLGTQVVVL